MKLFTHTYLGIVIASTVISVIGMEPDPKANSGLQALLPSHRQQPLQRLQAIVEREKRRVEGFGREEGAVRGITASAVPPIQERGMGPNVPIHTYISEGVDEGNMGIIPVKDTEGFSIQFKKNATIAGWLAAKIGIFLVTFDILFHCALGPKNASLKECLNNTALACVFRAIYKRNAQELRQRVRNLRELLYNNYQLPKLQHS